MRLLKFARCIERAGAGEQSCGYVSRQSHWEILKRNYIVTFSLWRTPQESITVFQQCRNHSPLQCHHNGHDSVSNHQPHDCLLNHLFRRRSKKTPKPRVTGLCVGNSPGTGEFPAQMASNAENVSIWWRHHVNTRNANDPCIFCARLGITKFNARSNVSNSWNAITKMVKYSSFVSTFKYRYKSHIISVNDVSTILKHIFSDMRCITL